MMNGIHIRGTGHYVPDFTVTNEDFVAFLDTSDEWIRTRTGMSERHLSKNQPTWYMGMKASQKALEAAGMGPSDIDMVLVTTVCPDYAYPSTACFIQAALGIQGGIATDISVACTGLSFALDMAWRYLQTGDVKNILVVSAEALTQGVDYQDRSTAVLFGDGAGACVVSAGEGMFASCQSTDPGGLQHIYRKYPRNSHVFNDYADTSEFDLFPHEKIGTVYMNGREVYKFATKAMPKAVFAACEKAGITPGDLDLIIPHQANLRIIETAVKNMKISMEKVCVNIEKYGNTSSASIAIALDECVRDGRVKRGDKVCVVGFGAGLTYGATVFTY